MVTFKVTDIEGLDLETSLIQLNEALVVDANVSIEVTQPTPPFTYIIKIEDDLLAGQIHQGLGINGFMIS